MAVLLLQVAFAHGQQAMFAQTSDPAGIVTQSAYYAVGTAVTTVNAPMESGVNRFTHWTLNGVRTNDYLGCGMNPVRTTIDRDIAAVAHYTNSAVDSDGDGVGDWYEWYYIGSLTNSGTSDGDGDGHTLAEEYVRDYQPLIKDRLVAGGVSRRQSEQLTLRIKAKEYRFTSEPAALVNQSGLAGTGTVVQTQNLQGDNGGYTFGYWTMDGVRQADRLGRSLSQLTFTVSNDIAAVAHYFGKTEDTDTDGLPDWWEWLTLGDLTRDGASNTDGDGYTLADEFLRDYEPLIKDRLVAGGVSRRQSEQLTLRIKAREYRFTSEPAGLVNQSGLAGTGTVVQTQNLQGDNGGYTFGYWTVDGVRQADRLGRSLSQLTFTVSNDIAAVAHYFGKTEDTDTDGLPDWWEWLTLGDLTRDGASNTDGDGYTLADEFLRDYEPLIKDRLVAGGVSRRQSALAFYLRPSPQLAVYSEYGGAVPSPGTRLYDWEAEVTCQITNSPILAGTTQYVCRGWAGDGSVPSVGASTHTGPIIMRANSSITWIWDTNYWVDTGAEGAGSVAPSDQWVEAGSNLAVTATANTGYHFAGWSGDAAGLENPLFVIGDGAKSVTANFTLNVITVLTDRTSVSVPEGGDASFQVKLSAQPTGDAVVIAGRTAGDADITVSDGASLSFTTANWDTYQTVTLAADEDDGDNQGGSAVITCSGMGVTNATVEATEADDDYTLTVDSLYGAVVLYPDTPYYDNGTEVTLTVTPQAPDLFKDWSGDLTETNNPASIMMDGNKSVTANYGLTSPVVLPPSAIAGKRFAARWKWVEGSAPEGEISVASNALFTLLVPGYEALYVLNAPECAVAGLLTGKDYWYRVRRVYPDDVKGPWSAAMKVRTGKGIPVFRNLLGDAPVSKGISQQFTISNLVSGAGTLKVKSSNASAVKATASAGVLTLQYLWTSTNAAKVTLTLTHPATGYKASYGATLSRAPGSVFKVGQSALTNAGTRAAQEVTLENRTGGMIYGLRLRALGLDNTAWLINRTGLDPVTKAAILEIPCVLPAGSQAVVRLIYNKAYKAQAATRPVKYAAWAIATPVHSASPVIGEMALVRQDLYDGLWLLGLPANGNRLYSVYHSDDDGATWNLNVPVIRATANYLMWLDIDEGAPAGRIYRVVDAGM